MRDWKRLEDVDPWVQEAASLFATVPGATTDLVAAYLARGKDQVKLALSHPVVKRHIESLQFQIIKARNDHFSKVKDKLTDIQEGAVDRMLDVLPEANAKEIVAIAKYVAEVHPDRLFVKMEKVDHKHEHTHRVTGVNIDELKQRHLAIASKPDPIEVEAEVVEEPELVEAT